ncbi:MAG: hypothetical protein EXR11_11855 [Rhodospirillaceae bacterium]|nr:hypothetical protein [Rhodospirillaceae bacterium]
MNLNKAAVVCAVMCPLLGCAMTSDVMDTGNGTYMISAAAAPVRGGAAGANSVAYKEANKFCGSRGGHAVVITADSRDVYQGAVVGSGGSIGGGVFAAGNTNMRFRCEN